MKFRTKQSDQVSGFLDKGTNVTGELEFAGTLRIDGNFQGSISTADNLIIGEHAMVHADIKVGEIEIHGQFFGTIEAKSRVVVFPSGQIRGDIHTPVLCVTAGAKIDGGMHMADDRSNEASPPPAIREETHREETHIEEEQILNKKGNDEAD
jgi:cytoskeletal protein CcmA (bactofilin family)